MAKIQVTDRDGAAHTFDVDAGIPLMEVLRFDELDVEGTCGGICSCGTCHVYIAADWVSRLSPIGEDEAMMLEAIGEIVEVNARSRLSCQIEVNDELDGLVVEVGPVA